MTGPRRLAVFLSGVWLVGWAVLYGLDPVFNWSGFAMLAGIPLVLVWGAWWLVAGFREKRT